MGRLMARRTKRLWTDEEKRSICFQTTAPGVSVARVARRYAMNANMVCKWLRDPRYAPEAGAVVEGTATDAACFLPVEITDRTESGGADPHIGPGPLPSSIEIDIAGGHRLRINGTYHKAQDAAIVPLITALDDAKLYNEVVGTVIAQKNDRTDQYERKVRRKTIPTASEMAEWLDWENHDTLGALLKELARRAIKETDQDTRYRADPIIQSAAASRIERFKQEVFAHLFARYLADKKILFIADIKDAQPTKPDELRHAMTEFRDASLEQAEAWHARFYTWLYLVPPPEISMLRHQMKKSVALETKSPTDTDKKAVEMLGQMDRLMALYTQVQAAGFSGTEHQDRLKTANFLYEDQNGFEKVYSNKSEDHDQTFAGTRRGLRQMVRYGDMQTLEPIFASHRVSKAEVTTFTEMTPASVKKLFADFVKLREDIIAATKAEKPKRGSHEETLLVALPANVARYERDLLKVAHYNFHASAARLTDHIKLHHVLMSVVAKLTDYALMWERDKTFAYFGMLYRAMEYEGCQSRRQKGPFTGAKWGHGLDVRGALARVLAK